MYKVLAITDHLISTSGSLSRLLDRLAERVVPHRTAQACYCPIICDYENCPYGLGPAICSYGPVGCAASQVWTCSNC